MTEEKFVCPIDDEAEECDKDDCKFYENEKCKLIVEEDNAQNTTTTDTIDGNTSTDTVQEDDNNLNTTQSEDESTHGQVPGPTVPAEPVNDELLDEEDNLTFEEKRNHPDYVYDGDRGEFVKKSC